MLLLCLSVSAFGKVEMKKQGTAEQIFVNDKPMLVLGGELSNSAATSVDDIKAVLPRMKALGLNTVLVPAQWDLIEPEEGHFDFSTIDATIETAREEGLKIIFLWFGAWKNSMSCYAPMWFKKDVRRFPRAVTASGKPLEIASVFSENVYEADSKAFLQLMRRIREKDSDTDNTVIMVQVENEIGMLEDARDHSKVANAVFAKGVPQALKDYLRRHASDLHQNTLYRITGDSVRTLYARKVFDNKLKNATSWESLFGSGIYTDEMFMAWYYAAYVERLCQAGKAIHDIPFYVNAAMNSRGRKPGQYPSAGPLAHLSDIWKAASPSLAMLAPDIYDTGFRLWAWQYHLSNNPLFIPESRCCENSGVRAMYVFGAHEAVGFSPFAINEASVAETENVTRAYALIDELTPLLQSYRGKNATFGLLFDQNAKEEIINDGDIVMTCRHNFTLPWDPRATDGSTWPEGGGIIIRLAKNDYVVAGNGIVVAFQTETEMLQEEQKSLGEDGFADTGSNDASSTATRRFEGKRIGIGFVDEVKVNANGKMEYVRRLNGDQSHQGRHVRISVGDYRILHVKLYEY